MTLITDVANTFEQQRKLAEGALQQVDDEQFFEADGPEGNSLAVIVKHVGGNLRSRWTDFLMSDGEKPDRNRDGEFLIEHESRDDVMRTWERGWTALNQALNELTANDLARTVTIRGQPCTVVQAMLRSLAHTAHHAGQIVHIAKVRVGDGWQSLSIPRGGSKAVNNLWK